LRAPAAVALPGVPAVRVRLSVAAPGGGRAELTIFGADGSATVRTVSPAPDAAAVVPLPAAARGVLVRPVAGDVVAALVLTAADRSGELVSVVGVAAPPPARSGPVRAVEDRWVGLSPGG
jgi:hypothetical protein